jgi:dephospho-CoA kinase
MTMLKVGLTGGIATGKSYVFDRLLRHGVAGLDADAIAHGVTAPGTEATAAIAERFGAGIIAADGSVDRAVLGSLVFADAAARRDLEAIVHPAVHRSIVAGLRAFELLGHEAVVVAVPLLFETGRSADYDRVVVTACNPELQLARLVARGLTVDAARQRMAAQLPTEEKVARANVTIWTDGSFEETDRQVDAVLEMIRTNAWARG